MTFKTKDIFLQFGDINIKLTIIENIDELVDALVQKGETHPDYIDQRIPYWAELWASAIALSEYLVENQHLISTTSSVTEIGCGLGLPSIVAGKLGAEVCFTDYEMEALDFAKLNWEQNIPDRKAHFQQFDWRMTAPSVAADILLASDVMYEERGFSPLLAVFKQLLKPNGTILITEPNRHVSIDFFSNLHTEGYHVKKEQRKILMRDHVFLVNVYEVRNK